MGVFSWRNGKARRDKPKDAEQQPLQEGKRGDITGMAAEARKKAIDSAIKNLKDANPKVRFSAAGKLEEIGDASAIDHLVKALNDEDWEVRKRAALTLGQVGDSSVVFPLIELLGEGNGEVLIYVQYSLSRILSACKDMDSIREFEKNLDDGLNMLAERLSPKKVPFEIVSLKSEVRNRKAVLENK